MNEELINHEIATHEKRINNHSDRLDKLEQSDVELKTQIKNLIDNINKLNTTIKWFIGLLVGSFIAFFFYAVQVNIFK